MESTTRGPSRQSGDRSLAPDNAGDIIGTKLGNILTNDIHEVFNYSYISYILLLSTVYHSRNILYIYIQQSTGSYSQTRGENGKELQHQYQVLPGRMTNHAGDAAQSPIQARKKSATKLEKAG